MADCLNKRKIYLKEAIEVKGEKRSEISVACGNCPRCVQRRKLEWGFRMEWEMREAKTAYFVTLTYDTKHVPINRFGRKTLNNKEHINEETGEITGGDLTRFFKRLRINQVRSKVTWEHYYNGLQVTDNIKYYACGEYGEKRKRPHYHAIIFNASKVNIEKSWKLGETHIAPANGSTIAYVMKYLDKNMGKKQDNRIEREFNTMSEGIGLSYVTKNQLWHKNNLDILFVTTMQGLKVPMPRYYRLKMFTEEERKMQMVLVEGAIQEVIDEGVKKLGAEKYWKNHWDQIRVEEKIFAKKTKKRNID